MQTIRTGEITNRQALLRQMRNRINKSILKVECLLLIFDEL